MNLLTLTNYLHGRHEHGRNEAEDATQVSGIFPESISTCRYRECPLFSFRVSQGTSRDGEIHWELARCLMHSSDMPSLVLNVAARRFGAMARSRPAGAAAKATSIATMRSEPQNLALSMPMPALNDCRPSWPKRSSLFLQIPHR